MAGCGRNRRSVEKERFWRGIMERQRASGLGMRPFCRREGIAESSFHYWKRTLRERDAERTSKASSPIDTQNDTTVSREAFVPVRLVEERAAGPIEILVPGGYVVRVADPCDAESLRCVLGVLQSVADAERLSC